MTRTLISGSTGLIGRALVGRLESDGHEVVRLVRPETTGGVSGVTWDPAGGALDACGGRRFRCGRSSCRREHR